MSSNCLKNFLKRPFGWHSNKKSRIVSNRPKFFPWIHPIFCHSLNVFGFKKEPKLFCQSTIPTTTSKAIGTHLYLWYQNNPLPFPFTIKSPCFVLLQAFRGLRGIALEFCSINFRAWRNSSRSLSVQIYPHTRSFSKLPRKNSPPAYSSSKKSLRWKIFGQRRNTGRKQNAYSEAKRWHLTNFNNDAVTTCWKTRWKKPVREVCSSF